MDIDSFSDCDSFVDNLIDPSSEDIVGNKSLCEKYFASQTTVFSALTDILTDASVTESSHLHSTMISEATESEDFVTTTVQPFVVKGFLESIGSAVNTTVPGMEAVETTTLGLEDYFISTSPEGLLDIVNATVKMTVQAIEETTSRMKEPFFAATSEDAFPPWLETTTFRSFKLEEDMDQVIKVASENHTMSLNNSLCQWYLPTIHQVPDALGNVGIALWALGFVITFILMLMFARQFHFILTTTHKSYRRHLYSITSMYVIMALMTSIGSGIPRAHAACSAMKDIYMSIAVGHFVDLTIAMYGGENVMAWHVKDRDINVRVILVCKCCFCIPKCETTKLSVNILKWLVWQMKWSQAIYYLIRFIWRKSLENSLGITNPDSMSGVLYLQIVNIISFVSGVFSLLIISSIVTEDLQIKYKYSIKAKTVRFTILATKLQRLLFEILEASNVFPCIPPLVSKRFYKTVLKDFIYLIEVLILGTITYFIYTRRGEFERGNSKEIPEKFLEDEEENENWQQGENGLKDEAAVALQTIRPGTESMC